MKIYLASSWRNPQQPEILAALTGAGHDVYDFRNPGKGKKGFAWSEIDPEWRQWTADEFKKVLLYDPIAGAGFDSDWNAMVAADACILLLPCGRSAHIEAGYFVGANKPLIILILGENEPELMYKMAFDVCTDIDDVIDSLNQVTNI